MSDVPKVAWRHVGLKVASVAAAAENASSSAAARVGRTRFEASEGEAL